MKKEQIILLPKLFKNNEIFETNKYFICSCCDMPFKKLNFINKNDKCEFCFFNYFSKKYTIPFTIKQFLLTLKINKNIFVESIIKILNKYKFIKLNWENFIFFINFQKNIEIERYEIYLTLFFEEIHNIINIDKFFNIKKETFVKTYLTPIKNFFVNKKRPIGKRILMPCFNNKNFKNLYKREMLNSKNILV